ncbi:penicillin-binding protein 1A [Massilia jejuensis]|uniref:Penicillin-binding protein 1A n=1 Tax=Massilia jejuensis TaxID=648894 RepID=A0ABW0PEG1_9BURK
MTRRACLLRGPQQENTVLTKSLRRPRPPLRRAGGFIFLFLAAIGFAVAGVAVWFITAVLPNVPSIGAVTDYKPKIPLRIYTADKVLIGEFGEEHRDFVPIAAMPPMMKKAVLAIEDARFYEHKGIDWMGAARAVKANLEGGFGSGGASTITMQVARNFFLSREKVLSRKLNEVVLAYKIEDALSKDQILELYMNQIFLGQRSYGFASAARSYFSKKLDQLTIAETAMLAGLPQNPSRHNPAVNPKRAKLRQEQVLRRMRDLKYIDEAQYAQAVAEPLRVHSKPQEFGTHAQYVAELARQAVFAQYAEASYTRGIKVYTTIDSKAQEAAYEAVRRNVLAYDSRHGYRGPEARIELPELEEEREEAIVEALQKRPSSDGLLAAVVVAKTGKSVKVETIAGDTITISGAGLKFAAAGLSEKAKDSQRIAPGAVVRISKLGKDGWGITQVPLVAAAFVALDADTGAYQALVGGFDYNLQKFNHVTQAWRQPGSAIKPFVYSAALEKGYGPGTLILDQELVMPGENAGADWSPQNDDGVFSGPVTMRHSLAHSKNVPTVRLLRAVEVPYAHDFLGKFGFDGARHPQNLTLALGTGAVTPLQMAGAYAVFANGGYGVKPYLIARVEDGDGTVLIETIPPAPRQEAARVLDARNAWVTDSMLRDVTRYGTGAAAKRLARLDIAGKTGTTSDAIDGWFAGYGGNIVAVAWMGYDEPRSLGGREFGATLALPIWLDYMHVALAKRPQVARPEPEGVLRENDDWIYAEFAEMPQFRAIDVETASPVPAPAETEEDDNDDHLLHPRADGEAAPAEPAPLFVPAQ